MSTQINIVVDSGGLRERAQQLQSAARQAQLEKERTAGIETEATTKRNEKLEAEGLGPDGLPLDATDSSQPEINRRPAANRIAGDGYFVLVSNLTVPISFDGAENVFTFGDSFNARIDARQPYDFYLGPTSVTTSLSPGDPEIPAGMEEVGLFDFQNYDEPVYYLVLSSGLKANSVLSHIPTDWTLGGTFKSDVLNIRDEQLVPWIIQSLSDTLNLAQVNVTGGGTVPWQLQYYVTSGYIKNKKLFGLIRKVVFNPNNQGIYRGNFYGLSELDRINLTKQPPVNEWILPTPAWSNSFVREP